jgi:hypothetical protein
MKLSFPKRTNTHVTEAGSWRLLQSLAPEEWIVREVSEWDYGTDAYIELVEATGEITGHLLSGQLKGVQSIEWQPSEDGGRIARSPSVKTSTAAYWLGLPIPVFLFVADLATTLGGTAGTFLIICCLAHVAKPSNVSMSPFFR